ncbi:MAG: hypothetical protein KKD05_06305 [Candidatus Omnitrophica bacterium]|nr:hypothetical protein [Candidatus Omnitrophota bacterium]
MKYVFLFLLIFLLVGCANETLEPFNEIVMVPGMTIESNNKNGRVKITYVGPLKRKYEIDEEQRIIKLFPRTTRWYGSLGIYNSAESIALLTFKTRIVCEEGQQHFNSIEEAVKWLNMQRPFNWVYRNDGLVFGFFRSSDRKQINIELWQIYVGGKFLSQFQESDFHRMSAFSYDYEKIPAEIDSNPRIVFLGGKKTDFLPGATDDSIVVKMSEE